MIQGNALAASYRHQRNFRRAFPAPPLLDDPTSASQLGGYSSPATTAHAMTLQRGKIKARAGAEGRHRHQKARICRVIGGRDERGAFLSIQTTQTRVNEAGSQTS